VYSAGVKVLIPVFAIGCRRFITGIVGCVDSADC